MTIYHSLEDEVNVEGLDVVEDETLGEGRGDLVERIP